ncbi:DNA glycosylase [Arthrobacter sp. H35-D1]|uniref:Fpg/Nei family DNA glycosylase n=1 Tax=Arthrobacter sp. H35-D1 TaxID=3046202 RepID=UPI0024B95497|nr:DNA glycosylase [Arthrobacter sp. H35-D1]MDJ0313917.1 zinc finger domain-containing protein [Arthrobacter sp. H35-D1]
MPEGHSVHRLARQFNDVFGGAALTVSSPQGKFTAGAARIDGHVLERAEAHGKQMFLSFSHDLVMRVHLGLYGAWDFGGDSTFSGASSIGAPRRIGEQEVGGDSVAPGSGWGHASEGPAASLRAGGGSGWGHASEGPAASLRAGGGRGEYAGPPEPKGAVRVRLVSDHGWADLRGPTACEVLTPAEAAAVRKKLGPDPLHNFPGDAEEFARRIRKSTTTIALQLMKQDVLAGVGNVYRAEVLFRLGLDPMLAGTSLQAEEAMALWVDITRIMADGVRDGRIITTEVADRPSGIGVGPGLAAQWRDGGGRRAGGGQDGGHDGGQDDGGSQGTASSLNTVNKDVPVEDAHYVYKREGLPCRHCGTEIAMKGLGGRKLYWCPNCQGG